MVKRRTVRRHTGGSKRVTRKRHTGAGKKRVTHRRRRMHGAGWLSALGSGIGKLGGIGGVLNGLGGVASIGSGIAGMVAANHQQQAIDEERDRQRQMWNASKGMYGLN